MPFTDFFDSNLYTWFVLPALIFTARIFDVSMGTIRVVFIARGYKYFAMIVGFFEILVWLMAIRQIMLRLSNPLCFLAYAAGFSMGTFTGIWLSEKLSLGVVIIRIVTKKDAEQLIEYLKTTDYGVTSIDAHGNNQPVKVIFMVVPRHKLKQIIGIVKEYNPQAFYSVEDVRSVKEGAIIPRKYWINNGLPAFRRPHQK